MTDIIKVTLKTPYLLLVGDESDPANAKTGLGIVHWRADDVAGQLRFSAAAVDLGVPDLDVDTAVGEGVGSLVIGVAPIGGRVPAAWWEVMQQAAAAGLDIVSGLHTRLVGNPALRDAAAASGARLVDVRVPPDNLPVANGRKRSGLRILSVGTDCAVGKKYAALSLDAAFRAAGLDSTFRATGQTGIMIAGEGMPIDAVIADFIAGAAEVLSPDNEPDHWDIIEGQGSLLHPAYSGVSLGLLHGSQPDGIVICHDATRQALSGWEHYPLPALDDSISLHERLARRTNPRARCVGICVNTSALPRERRGPYLEALRERHGLPAVDPVIDGCGEIVNLVRHVLP
jgi:D-glutamate N-acetyltransferase